MAPSAPGVPRETFDRARDFVYSQARLLERQLFRYRYEEGPKALVLSALAAYQNADGGFGNALEPDKRTPYSQPIDVETAFEVLDELDAMDSPMVPRACGFLESVSTPDGGVPFSLPSVNAFAHAPWWGADEDPPAAINPTAGLAAILLRNGVRHPWLDGALAFCRAEIERSESTQFHDLREAIHLLEALADGPEAEWAQRQLDRLAERIGAGGLIETDPDAQGYVMMPLDWAPTPRSFARRLVADDVVERHLEALHGKQQPDGGWPISWPTVSPAVELEWRGIVTLRALRTLEAYAG
jgi:hypothetical protein